MKVLSYITAATVAAFPMQAAAQHFEIEIIDGNFFLPVWGGAIDLTEDTGTGSDTDSFGESEDFSFGIVTEGGSPLLLLPPPADPIIDPVDDGIENILDSSAGILD